jgi:hypothetical protein
MSELRDPLIESGSCNTEEQELGELPTPLIEIAEDHAKCWEPTSRLLVWEALLTSGFAWNILWAKAGIPSDNQLDERGYVSTWQDLTTLWTYGLLTFWFVNLYDKRRHDYIFRDYRQRWHPFALFFGAGPAFSLFSMIPGFQSSLSSNNSISPGMITTLVLLLCCLCYLIFWHCRYAFQIYPRDDFYAFIGIRIAIVVVLVIEVAAASAAQGNSGGAISYELHHWCLAWLVTLWCSFNRKWSAVLLGGSAGVMVQGIGAYSAARVLTAHTSKCYYFKYPEVDTFVCSNSIFGGESMKTSYMQMCMQRPYLGDLPSCGPLNNTASSSGFGSGALMKA